MYPIGKRAAGSARWGGGFFFSGPGFTDELGSKARCCGWERAGRLGPHKTRRGAARAILDAGGSFAKLLRAGHWHSSAYRAHLDIGIGETKSMALILIEAADVGGPERRGRRDGAEIPQRP